MTLPLRLDVETGLPSAEGLLEALRRDAHALRILEVLAVRGPDGIEEPLALADDPQAGRLRGGALQEFAADHGGSAFRLGGTLYALLLPADVSPGVVASEVHALVGDATERVSRAVIHARVSVPLEAPPSRAAVRLAFRRLRARAACHPLAPGRQVRDVLLQLLAERCPPGDQVRRPEVAGNAVSVGHRLGLSSIELDDLLRAAELQDVGMLILQSSVLGKASPLDAEDWAVIRHHPVVGERVIAAAASLASVAAIVRSCYERYDGTGYPDGLKAEAIPLSARIIAVCVAYDAMTSWRPYRPPLTPAAAMHELVRCAGTQFDPRIVALFQDVVGIPRGDGRRAERVA
ncbi:MAG: diguanylate cyclase and metal dependent phosphohydrolase [Conexibacter sp.]|nr:diguanylate cyclase and metal dependent phosphohydrolase [Conexibacter sp.]